MNEKDMAESMILSLESLACHDMKRVAVRNIPLRMVVSMVQTKMDPSGTTCLTRFLWNFGSESSMFICLFAQNFNMNATTPTRYGSYPLDP